MVKTLHKDLRTISSLPMLVDPHVAFATFRCAMPNA